MRLPLAGQVASGAKGASCRRLEAGMLRWQSSAAAVTDRRSMLLRESATRHDMPHTILSTRHFVTKAESSVIRYRLPEGSSAGQV